MEIAINTGSLSFDTPAAVAQAKGLGFTALEVNLQQAELRYRFNRQPDLAIFDMLAQEIELRGMDVVSVHNLFLTSAQAFSQGARREILHLAARVAARLNAPFLLVHPVDLFCSEEALAHYLTDGGEVPVISGFDELRAEMEELEVDLVLENVNHWCETLLTNQADHMRALIDALECEVAFDVTRGLSRPSLERWVERIGDRVVLCHLYDKKDGEEHHPPLDPAWSGRISLLKDTAAQACVIEASASPMSHANIRASREFIRRLWDEA